MNPADEARYHDLIDEASRALVDLRQVETEYNLLLVTVAGRGDLAETTTREELEASITRRKQFEDAFHLKVAEMESFALAARAQPLH